jgi:hypothetical protein
MKRHLSRKEFLSLGVSGGLALVAAHCTLDDVPETTGSGGNGGATGSTSSTSSGASGSATSSSTGNGGGSSSTTTSSTTNGGSAGSGGSTSTGNGGNGGSGGTGGSSAGGKGGGGGSAGSGGKGGSGGSGGSKDAGAGGGGQDGGASCTSELLANISMNHVGMEHELHIPAADIAAGVAKVYVTTGALQNHMHYVSLTAADFMTLKMGGVVTKHSCNGGDHQYTIKCGTPPTAGTQTCTSTDNCGMSMSGATGPCT